VQRVIVILLASLWGLGLLVIGLWTWQRGPVLIDYFHATRLPLATWATRAAAVSLASAGEALVALVVVGNLWNRRDAVTRFLGRSAVLVFLLAGVAAATLGVLAR
jgi:hypothetical protein